MKAERRHGCELAVCLDCPRQFPWGYQKALLARHAELNPGHRCFEFDAHFYGWGIDTDEFDELLRPRLEALFADVGNAPAGLPARYLR
jgi:hypothetical protein